MSREDFRSRLLQHSSVQRSFMIMSFNVMMLIGKVVSMQVTGE